MAAPKPVILPETFTGEANWDEWAVHFDHCADINGWDDAAKLRFLRVRLTGRARSVFQRLPEDKKDTFDHAKSALRERFEPSSKRELYVTELSTRRKRPTEGWADLADDLRRLAAKAYPDLEASATDQLALTHYLMGISDVQLALPVKQKSPKSLDEAVSYTIQVESHLLTARVASMGVADYNSQDVLTNAVHTTCKSEEKSRSDKEDKLLAMIQKLDQRLENIEHRSNSSRPQRQRKPPEQIICHNCGQAGHYARGCAAPRRKQSRESGN